MHTTFHPNRLVTVSTADTTSSLSFRSVCPSTNRPGSKRIERDDDSRSMLERNRHIRLRYPDLSSSDKRLQTGWLTGESVKQLMAAFQMSLRQLEYAGPASSKDGLVHSRYRTTSTTATRQGRTSKDSVVILSPFCTLSQRV